MDLFSNYKIRRGRKIYHGTKKQRPRWFRISVTVFGFCVLFFFGFSIAEPVMSFLSGDMRIQIDKNYNNSSQTVSKPEEETPSSSEAAGTKAGFSEIKAAFMPNGIFTNDDLFNGFITQAKAKGLNTAVIEVKDNSGIIYYNSKVSQAKEIGAVIENAPNLKDRIAALSQAGIQTIVRISTFKDPLAAKKIKGAAARYSKDITSVWLDNYADQGGKPWVNPESSEGTGYITALINELAASGASYVMADNFNYPTGQALNLAYFGPKSNDSRTAVLNTYISQLEQQLSAANCGLIVTYPAEAYLTKSDLIYGGSPANVTAKLIAPVISPADFKQGITIGKEKIENPAQQPYDITKAFTESLLNDLFTGTSVIPMIHYDDTGAYNEQIKALSGLSVKPYILYAEDGRYE